MCFFTIMSKLLPTNLLSRTPITAATNSSLGTVITFKGAMRGFAATKMTDTSPSSYSCLRQDTAAQACSEASTNVWIVPITTVLPCLL